MADIFDLMPASESLVIGETQTVVHPIQLGHALKIINRFPSLTQFLDGRKEASFAEILSTGSVPAILAAGCGRFGDEDAENHFASMDADTQAQFLGAVLRLTMPRGVAPFLISVRTCAEGLTGPPQPKYMTREEIAKKLLGKNSGNSSPPPSLNTEEPLENAISGQ